MNTTTRTVRYLLASDFDQTLSFNDSGQILSELLGISGFDERVSGLAHQNLVQQGAELTYLLRHDPEFRRVRREHLVETGKRIRLKRNVEFFQRVLDRVSKEHRFLFYVVSAAPQEVVESALQGIVAPNHIFGTRFEYDSSGEIQRVIHCRAGYGKVAAVNQLHEALNISQKRIIYVGDGSSDIHVMLHVNRLGGLTIAVSENRFIQQVARRIVLSDDVLSVTVPILEEILDWDAVRISAFFESEGFLIRQWDKLQTDTLIIGPSSAEEAPEPSNKPVAAEGTIF